MIETLETLDRALLLYINGCHAPFFDTLFYIITKPWTSIPFYLLAFLLLLRKYGWKRTILYLVAIVCAIGLSDLISTECFKKVICRYRPTHNLDIGNLIHIVNGYRGGMYGFVSSHAANMFAFAVSLSLFLQEKRWGALFFAWACIVCYTRMYLGVHYPTDILCGALLGILIATIVYFYFRYIEQRFILNVKK